MVDFMLGQPALENTARSFKNNAFYIIIFKYILFLLFLLFSYMTCRGECTLDISMDEGKGRPGDKASSNTKKVTMGKGVKWIRDNGRNFLYFDGSKDADMQVINTNIGKSDALFFSVWIKPEPSGKFTDMSLLKGPNGSGWENGWRIKLKPRPGGWLAWLEINFGDKKPRGFSFGFIPSKKFSQLCFSVEHPFVKLFLNGKKVGEYKEERKINYAKDKVRNLTVGFAHQINYRGIVCGIKMFDSSLIPAEVTSLYNAGNNLDVNNNEKKRQTFTKYYKSDDLHVPDFSKSRNLVQNPSFESGYRYVYGGANNFSLNKLIEVSEDNPASGLRCLKLYNKSKERGPWIKTFGMPSVPGADYTLSFCMRGNPGGHIYVRVNSGDWLTWPLSKRIEIESNKWKRYEFTFRAPDSYLAVAWFVDGRRCSLPKGTLYNVFLDDIQLEKGSKATDFTFKPVSADLVTDKLGNIFNVNDTAKAKFRISAPPKMKGELEFTVTDILGKEILKGKKEFIANDKGVANIPLNIDPKIDFGLYIIRADFKLANGFKDYDYFRFSRMHYMKDAFIHRHLFALNMFCLLPNREAGIEFGRNIGFGTVIMFSSVLPESYRKLLDKYGMWLLSSVFYGGAYSYGGDGSGSFYSDSKRKGVFIRDDKTIQDVDIAKVVENAAGIVKANKSVKYWKLANEPSHDFKDNPDKLKIFMEMLRKVSAKIKEINPNAVITSPDPTNMYPGGGTAEIEAMIKNGLLDIADIIAIHPYRPRPEEPDFDVELEFFLKMLDKYGYKGDVWFTEGIKYEPYSIPEIGVDPELHIQHWRNNALSYDSGLGELLAAAYSMRQWLVGLKYADRVKVLTEWKYDDYYLDVNMTPRAYVWSVNTLAKVLGNSSYLRDIDICDSARCYLFIDGEKRPVAVIWNIDRDIDRDKSKAPGLTLPFDEESIDIFNMFGTKIPYSPGTKININAYPVFVRSKRPVKPENFASKLQKFKIDGAKLTLIKTKVNVKTKDTFCVTLTNRISRTISGRVDVFNGDKKLLSKAITLEPKKSQKFDVTPEKTKEIFAPVPLKVIFAPSKGDPQTSNTRLQVLTCPMLDKAPEIDGDLSDWPVMCRKKLPDTHKEFAVPRGLKNKYPNPIAWRGSKDLSGDFFCGWTKNYLYLAFEITDDVQSMPAGDAATMHRWDGVQLYIDTNADARNHKFTGFDNNDYGWNFCLLDDGTEWVFRKQVPEWQIAFLKRGAAPEILRSFKRKEGKTIYEIAIPASQLVPLPLKKGSCFGLDFMITDNDDDYRKRGIVINSDKQDPWRKPHIYPVMILTEKK